MQFTGQNFSYDIDRRLKQMSSQLRSELSLGLLGGYGSEHAVTEPEEAYSLIQYTSFGNLYVENMRTFLDNAIKYRITDNPFRPGSTIKGGKGLLKGRINTVQTTNNKTTEGYLFGTDMRAQNLQFDGGVLAVNNNGSRVKRGTYGLALGSHTVVKGQNGFCAGKGTIAKQNNQFSIGKYNVCYENSVFEIGYGDSNGNRKTIFMVDGEGNVSAAGKFTPNAFMTDTSTHEIGDENVDLMSEEINNFIEANAKLVEASIEVPYKITKNVTNALVVKPIEIAGTGVKTVGKAISKIFSW